MSDRRKELIEVLAMRFQDIPSEFNTEQKAQRQQQALHEAMASMAQMMQRESQKRGEALSISEAVATVAGEVAGPTEDFSGLCVEAEDLARLPAVLTHTELLRLSEERIAAARARGTSLTFVQAAASVIAHYPSV